MAPRSLDDLAEQNPQLAAQYDAALAELKDWVGSRMRRGKDPFGTEYFNQMVKIQTKHKVTDAVWDYLDHDGLILGN